MPMSSLPLKCRCHESNWTIHPAKISCGNKYCNFTEHFTPHEPLMDIINRMKSSGCYYLDKDAHKLEGGVLVYLSGYIDRR